MASTAIKHKHLKLDQKKIDFAKRYFGVDSEQSEKGDILNLAVAITFCIAA